jgi:subtilisin family serine protease
VEGIAGEAYASLVMPVKVLDSNGNGTYAGISSGIISAADHGAEVINLSLSGTAYSKTMCDAVSYAISRGAVVVAAAGNDSTSIQEYPAACPGAIGVGATDSNDALAPFSDYGYPAVFVTAPGVSILSTYPGGGYQSLSGTSMAAPYVSGLAALLMGESPGRSVADVKRILASTADKTGASPYGGDQFGACGGACSWSSSFGYGRINVASALAFVPSPDFVISASPASATARQGGSASFTVSADALDGYSGSVSFSVNGLPAGATASFNQASVAVPGNATLTISAASSTPVGSYPLTLSASDGAVVHTASATLVVAAVYELTPLKDVCLGKCRSPLGFLLGAWRDGRAGALWMGARHGAWCLGCCWALMASLLALGVMSLGWMALVAALIALEKTLPWPRAATYGTAALLLALGVLVLAVPGSVPGLTIPGGMMG